jgi:hypothetical protein
MNPPGSEFCHTTFVVEALLGWELAPLTAR